MSKVIEFNTPWGVYQLPLDVPVKNRTDYYANSDGFAEDSDEYKKEWSWVYGDDFEAIDWLLNSMDWEGVKDKAVKVGNSINVTEGDFWTSSDDFMIKEGSVLIPDALATPEGDGEVSG